MKNIKVYQNIIGFIAVICILCGCAGKSEMHRINLQVSANYAQQKKPGFDRFADFVIGAISSGNSKLLLEKFDPKTLSLIENKARVEMLVDQAIEFQSLNKFSFSENKNPLLSMNEREDFGYEYKFKAKAETCSATLVITAIIPEDANVEQIYIWDINFEKTTGDCKDTKNE